MVPSKVSSFYGHALRVHVIAMIVAADQGRVKRRPGASSSDGGVYQVEHDPQNEQTDADQDANAPTDGASQCHSLVVGQALVGLFLAQDAEQQDNGIEPMPRISARRPNTLFCVLLGGAGGP